MSKKIPTVLVVEDEESLLKAWAEIFRKEGLDVLTALDAPSAFALAQKYYPDLLIVGLVMDSSDTIALIKKLRGSIWGKKIPVMFLSGSQSVDMVESTEANELPLKSFYFHNNWNFSQVLEAVRKRLHYVNLKQGVF